jgi:hypothetical protein
MPEMLGNALIVLTSAAVTAAVGYWLWSLVTRERPIPPRKP